MYCMYTVKALGQRADVRLLLCCLFAGVVFTAEAKKHNQNQREWWSQKYTHEQAGRQIRVKETKQINHMENSLLGVVEW